MSAPDGDLDRQARKHRGQLVPMFAVVLFVLVLLVFLGFWAFRSEPEGAETQVQSGLGLEGDEEVDAVSANTRAGDGAEGGVIDAEADPTAVTVPSLQVESPQTGMNDNVNPLVGQSESAVPLDPVAVEEGGEGVTGD